VVRCVEVVHFMERGELRLSIDLSTLLQQLHTLDTTSLWRSGRARPNRVFNNSSDVGTNPSCSGPAVRTCHTRYCVRSIGSGLDCEDAGGLHWIGLRVVFVLQYLAAFEDHTRRGAEMRPALPTAARFFVSCKAG
jgi:hypothetical protein